MAAGAERQFDDDSLSIFVVPEGSAPEGGAAAPAARPRATPPPRRLSVVRSLRRHWIVALAPLAAAVLAAVPLLLWLRRPLYSAEATILVSQTFAKNLSDDRELQLPRYGEFVKQQLVLLKREEVALDALERLGERRSLRIAPGESRRDAALRLSRDLETRQVPETSYLSVSLDGPAPEGLAEVVNAVVESYLARVRGQPFTGLDLRLEALNRHKAQLTDEIRSKTELLSRWAKEHGVAGFDPRTNDVPVQEAEKSLQTARARRSEGEARLAAFDARQEILKAADLSAEAREAINSDPEFAGLKAAYIAKKNDQRSKLTGLTPEHEGRKAAEKLIAEIDAEIAKAETAAVERYRTLMQQRRDARLKDERQVLVLELDQARKIEKVLTDDAAQVSKKAQRFNDVYYDAQNVQQEVERLRRQLGAVEDRIDMMRLETYAPGFVHLAAPATPPGAPIPVRVGKWLALLAAAGLLLAVGLPVLIDTVDPRVRVPGDLLHEMEGTALVGLPVREPASEAFVRDQLRRLALGIDRDRRQRSQRRLVVTGVKFGAGTSRITLDIAVELQQLGIRAVVVEANAFKPDPRYAPPQHAGLLDVLRRKVTVEDALLPATAELPARMPVGATGGRTILAEVSRLSSVFSDIGDRCDLVLIDAPPVLLSSDAEMLAGLADAVVLVVGSRDTTVPEVRRAVRILRQVGTPVVRAVMNRVELRGGGRSRDYADLIKEYNVAARAPTP